MSTWAAQPTTHSGGNRDTKRGFPQRERPANTSPSPLTPG